MALSCQFFLDFPCTIFHLFPVFPSFSFSFRFPLVGVLFLLKLSSSSLHLLQILVSSFFELLSFLRFQLFMVDYSLVRLDCPSMSFFFVRLCGLLQFACRKCPLVGFFVGTNCPFKFLLLFLFLLVYHSIGFAQTLIMFGKEEVRTSELEMGLSSFEDCGVPEVSSPFIPFKAWCIRCTLREKK